MMTRWALDLDDPIVRIVLTNFLRGQSILAMLFAILMFRFTRRRLAGGVFALLTARRTARAVKEVSIRIAPALFCELRSGETHFSRLSGFLGHVEKCKGRRI